MTRKTVAAFNRVLVMAALFGFSMPLPGKAQGQCPTASDMDAGVRAVFANGDVADYRRLKDDLLEIFEAGAADSRDGTIVTSRLGIYDLDAADIVDGVRNTQTALTLKYSAQESDLPIPVSGESWVGGVVTSSPGAAEETQAAVYVFGAGGTREFSGCVYDTIPVKVSFLAGEDWLMEEFIYIPSLPLAILSGHQFSGMDYPEGRAIARLERLQP
ncbi:MAG: hypothetical protein WBO29_14375 [Albidovulum sp.]